MGEEGLFELVEELVAEWLGGEEEVALLGFVVFAAGACFDFDGREVPWGKVVGARLHVHEAKLVSEFEGLEEE